MIRNWLRIAASSTQTSVIDLDNSQLQRILGVIHSRFLTDEEHPSYLWEGFSDEFSIHREDGWVLACHLFQERSILMFQNGSGYEAVQVDSADSLLSLLSECPGFEFYVTDAELESVICFNHHDYLIGVGKCKERLQSLVNAT